MTPSATQAPRRRTPKKSANRTVGEVEARIDGHEVLCTERFKNLDAKVDNVQKSVDAQANRQEGYHRSNTQAIDGVKDEIAELRDQVIASANSMAGTSGAVRFIVQYILPLVVPAAMLAVVLIRGHG